MTTDFNLYYSPGACSLSPHIALLEAGLPMSLTKVDTRNKKLADGGDWLAINPKGYVPALGVPSGDVITEGAVLIRYIADQVPGKKLAPANGTMERVKLDETLHFIATEIHKGFAPLFNPALPDEMKTATVAKVGTRFAALEKQLGDKQYLFGDFTIADGYLFWTMFAWQKFLKQSLEAWPKLAALYTRIAARPMVAKALTDEGMAA